MDDSILKILEMVQDGTISAQEGKQLMDAQKKADEYQTNQGNVRMLKIKVHTNDGDKVNINLPATFIKNGVDFAQLNLKQLKKYNINFEAISQALDAGYVGEVVNVESNDGDLIIVTIE